MMTIPRRVCLVTGAASGYGKAICQHLFDRGENLVLVDVNDTAGVLFSNTLNSGALAGQSAVFCQGDVTSQNDMRRAFETAKSYFHSIDVVVNNAGIWENCEFAKDKDLAWRKVIDIDLIAQIMGTWLSVQYNVPTVVNMASVAGLAPVDCAPIYTAAKHGVVGFTTSLSDLYATTNTRVNCIAPWGSDTPLVRQACAQSETTAKIFTAQGPMVPVSLVVDAVVMAMDDQSLVCRVLVVQVDGIHIQQKVGSFA